MLESGKRNSKSIKVSPLKERSDKFTVYWNNLSYFVEKGLLSKKTKTLILNKLSGYFESGKLTALMGPSGAGKTTLLKCITGLKEKNVSGTVMLSGIDQVLIGMAPQNYDYLNNLTVRETIVFSCQLLEIKNLEEKTEEIISNYDFKTITDTKVSHCSGGQKKLLAIAIEVLSKPNILILDEPTTGLDSSSCSRVVNKLLKLTKNDYPIAIVTTIHQPSYEVFSLFHWVYILTRNGKCMFQGNPIDAYKILLKHNFSIPNNPADLVIEVANGDYGEESIRIFVESQKNKPKIDLINNEGSVLTESIKKRKSPIIKQFLALLHRSILATYRDSYLIYFRFMFTIFVAVSIGLIYGKDDGIGKVSGCLYSPEQLYVTNLTILTRKFENDFNSLTEAVSMIFMIIFCSFFFSISSVLLSFTTEMNIFLRESRNGWYSTFPFYLAKFFTDSLMQILTSSLFITIIYELTGQPDSVQRELSVILLFVLSSLTTQTLGQIIGAYWCDNPSLAAFVGILTFIPFNVYTGYMIKIVRIPAFLKPGKWISYLRFTYRGVIILIYGFDRCEYDRIKFLENNNIEIKPPRWVMSLPFIMDKIDEIRGKLNLTVYQYGDDKVKDEDDYTPYVKRLYKIIGGSWVPRDQFDIKKSLLLNYYSFTDEQIYPSFYGLLVFFIIFQVSLYFVMIIKRNSNQ